jgi:hypothetical protein
MYYFHICWVHNRFEWQMCKSGSNRNVAPKVQTPAAQHASFHRGAMECDQCCERLACSVAAGPEPEARLEAVPSQFEIVQILANSPKTDNRVGPCSA